MRARVAVPTPLSDDGLPAEVEHQPHLVALRSFVPFCFGFTSFSAVPVQPCCVISILLYKRIMSYIDSGDE